MTDDDKPALLVEKNVHPVTELWAVLSVDANGNEGICAGLGPDGWMPLVVTEERLLAGIMSMAQQTATMAKGMRKLRLVRFKRRGTVREIEP